MSNSAKHLFAVQVPQVFCAISLLLAGPICWSAPPVKIAGPREISLQRSGSVDMAGFVHAVTFKSGETYTIPVMIDSDDTEVFLRSLRIVQQGQPFTAVSFYLEDEELEPALDQQLPGVLSGDDFDIAGFRKLLLGQQITVFVQREGFSAQLAAGLDRTEPRTPGLSASLVAPPSPPVAIEGELIGLAAPPGTLKLLVAADAEKKIVEIKPDSIVSIQFAGKIAPGLDQALRLKRHPHIRHLIIAPTAGIPDTAVTISYEYTVPPCYEIEAIGELSLVATASLNVTGWIKLRNATIWDWQNTLLTLKTEEANDRDYELGQLSLEKTKVQRLHLPLPQPASWTFPAELGLLVGEASDGADVELPVRWRLQITNPARAGAVPLMTDRLVVQHQGTRLGTADDFGELQRDAPPRTLVLQETALLTVKADRASNRPLQAKAISAADGMQIICLQGRATLYRITANGPIDNLPIYLSRGDPKAYEPLGVSSLYEPQTEVYLLKDTDDLSSSGVETLLIPELHSPPTFQLVSIETAETGDYPGGLTWLQEHAKSEEVRKLLEESLDVRQALSQASERLRLLESQLDVLRERQGKYRHEPQSLNHGAITGEFDNLIGDKLAQIGDQRGKVALQKYRLDRLAQKFRPSP